MSTAQKAGPWEHIAGCLEARVLQPPNKSFIPFSKLRYNSHIIGNSLAVQWLGLRASTAGGMGSIPGWGTKIPQAPRHGQKTKQKNPHTS